MSSRQISGSSAVGITPANANLWSYAVPTEEVRISGEQS